MSDLIGAIDQGTQSTRLIVFDKKGEVVVKFQKEHKQITPQEGWVEHDPEENHGERCRLHGRRDGAACFKRLRYF
jgi:glycerol kinase